MVDHEQGERLISTSVPGSGDHPVVTAINLPSTPFGEILDSGIQAAARTASQDGPFIAWFIPAYDTHMDRIQSDLRRSGLVIADVTDNSPALLYLLGLISESEKPLILIRDTASSGNDRLPQSLRASRVFSYDSKKHDQDDFLAVLGSRIDAVMSGESQPTASADDPKPKVFISYSHRDAEYLNRLLVHLKPLDARGIVDVWADTKIKVGDDWRLTISQALEDAVAAVLLVSADFMASDFIVEHELPPLLEAASTRGARLMSLILKPCRYSRDESLSRYQAANDPRRPLSTIDADEREIYYDKLAADIEALF